MMDEFDRLRIRVRQLERSRDAIIATLAVVLDELGGDASDRVAAKLNDLELMYVGRRGEDPVAAIASSSRRPEQ